MRRSLRRCAKSVVVATLIQTSACSTLADESSEKGGAITLCTDPRPEICTMIYDPVCGQLDDGWWKTYSSDCSACSDAEVKGWKSGECEN